MAKKCVCLYSGGLDSRLIVALMHKLGLEVIVYHGLHSFECKETFENIKKRVTRDCTALGASKVVFRDMTLQIVELLRKNKYGFGKNLNPCVDCRINTVSNGFEVMKEEGADFICSGEVIGQRPKSQQRHGMSCVTQNLHKLGFDENLLLRPLCAKLLEPTTPEQEGWVDREKLYDFNGRGRNQQFTLAMELGVKDYPAPAGGCLLTDCNFCLRMKDLLEFEKNIKNSDIDLLKFGRHYRTPDKNKIVVSRSGDEGDIIDTLVYDDDHLFLTKENTGAFVVLRGQPSENDLKMAAGLAVYHSRNREKGSADVLYWRGNQKQEDACVMENVNTSDPKITDPFRLG